MNTLKNLKIFDEANTPSENNLHYPSNSAEVYKGEPFTAKIKFTDSSPYTNPVPLYRISPMGAEFDISDLDSSLSTFLKMGSILDVEINMAGQRCPLTGVMVGNYHIERGKTLLGVRWCLPKPTLFEGENRRSANRWLCGDGYLPIGIAPNSTRFNDFIHFKIVDLSKDGMQILTSFRNKFIVPGMILDAMVTFPLVGQASISFKILNVRSTERDGKEFISLGVSFVDLSHSSLETISQYILQFAPDANVQNVKSEFSKIKFASNTFDYSFVRSMKDYQEVLDLRKTAYSNAGKVDSNIALEAMGDSFDSCARILTVRHKSRLVASCRIMFHDTGDETEIHSIVKIPDSFPRLEEMTVITRTCTHPEYRGSDLLDSVVKQMALVSIQAQRRYALGFAAGSLIPLWNKLGFKSTGIKFKHPNLNNIEHEVLIADFQKIISGNGISLGTWNRVYKTLVEFAETSHIVSLSPITKAKLNFYRGLAPIQGFFGL